MKGKAEAARLRQRLDAKFKRAAGLGGEAELQSDFAQHLCVLVSGYLEQAVVEVLIEYTSKHSDRRIQAHIESRLRKTTNLNSQKLCSLFQSFDGEWGKQLSDKLIDEFKDSVDSIVNLRNLIAHGKYAGGVTLIRTQEYYSRVKIVIDKIILITGI